MFVVLMKVDVRLPGEGNSNTHGARPVQLIITTIKRILTSRLSKKNSLFVVLTTNGTVRQREVSLGMQPRVKSLQSSYTGCRVTPVMQHGVSSHSGQPTRDVKSLRSSYTGCQVTPVILHGLYCHFGHPRDVKSLRLSYTGCKVTSVVLHGREFQAVSFTSGGAQRGQEGAYAEAGSSPRSQTF